MKDGDIELLFVLQNFDNMR